VRSAGLLRSGVPAARGVPDRPGPRLLPGSHRDHGRDGVSLGGGGARPRRSGGGVPPLRRRRGARERPPGGASAGGVDAVRDPERGGGAPPRGGRDPGGPGPLHHGGAPAPALRRARPPPRNRLPRNRLRLVPTRASSPCGDFPYRAGREKPLLLFAGGRVISLCFRRPPGFAPVTSGRGARIAWTGGMGPTDGAVAGSHGISL